MKLNLEAIGKIESSGNDKAFNKKSGARGLMQITPICLEDYNLAHPKEEPFTLMDLFDKAVSLEIAAWYLEKRIPQILKASQVPVTLETVIASWNWGPKNAIGWHKAGGVVKDLPRETRNFITKYAGLSK